MKRKVKRRRRGKQMNFASGVMKNVVYPAAQVQMGIGALTAVSGVLK